ncbi:hypothetical protein Dsin_013974 [Dipteronia sinensis]|uniref:RNase H type-1 domain-containing protein n=1 Tax=Dipteronia sinensis TaxID=43782 RepID=A0AAE0AM70_9ROSI|nr:hypothetical protein Dsin_013974 [Dipteronia sinensis]
MINLRTLGFDELGGKDIAVVSDSKMAVAWINKEDFGNLAHINSIYDIRSCMSNFGNLEVVYDSRAYNSFADSLAKMGSSMGFFLFVLLPLVATVGGWGNVYVVPNWLYSLA